MSESTMLFDLGSDLAMNTGRRSEGLPIAKQKVAWDQYGGHHHGR